MTLIDARVLSRAATPENGLALWNLGFRPFYLLASLWAAASVPLWVAQYAGWLPAPQLGMMWHAHEMVFGFATAVVAGFLLTAVRTWTNRPTPSGGALIALAALWIAARIFALASWGTAATVASVAFPLAVAASIAVPIVRARNFRNIAFVVLLCGLAAAAFSTHLSLSGAIVVPALFSVQSALDVLLLLITLIGGRVLPMFTNNGVPGAGAERRQWLEWLASGSVGAVLLLDSTGAVATFPLASAVFVCTAIVHAGRWALWKPWRVARKPLVGVLHAAYAWVPLHFALRALALHGFVPSALALHALTIGAVSGMIIGMMVRTTRGHTGRALVADRWDTTAFVLVQAAAILRVFGGLAFPEAYVACVVASAAAWCGAFALFFVRFAGPLCRPRLDGKPG